MGRLFVTLRLALCLGAGESSRDTFADGSLSNLSPRTGLIQLLGQKHAKAGSKGIQHVGLLWPPHVSQDLYIEFVLQSIRSWGLCTWRADEAHDLPLC